MYSSRNYPNLFPKIFQQFSGNLLTIFRQLSNKFPLILQYFRQFEIIFDNFPLIFRQFFRKCFKQYPTIFKFCANFFPASHEYISKYKNSPNIKSGRLDSWISIDSVLLIKLIADIRVGSCQGVYNAFL